MPTLFNNEDDNNADEMIKLYSMPSLGNFYKVCLLLAKLAIPIDHIAVEHDEISEIPVDFGGIA
jgi:hypothetical protein